MVCLKNKFQKSSFAIMVLINFEFGYGHGGFGSSGARAFEGSLVE